MGRVKKMNKQLAKEIKRLEKEKREQQSGIVKPTVELDVNKVEFDEWWILRKKLIPKQHMKEIIKADFIGRGLKDKETIEKYDEYLKIYGISV